MALIVEAAELLEHFQWLTLEQSESLAGEKRREVELEMADIFIYLMRLCERLDVDLLKVVDASKMVLLPTLALAIPFSARVMAYVRYPYAQDYADFMPGAVFVLLMVAALGTVFAPDQQKFFLEEVWIRQEYRLDFLRNGVFLAFIPVFFEGGFWLLELSREEPAK